MTEKIPWSSLYSAFRKKFPNWRSQVLHWEPYDYMKILIECKNGKLLVYDHYAGLVRFVTKETVERKKNGWQGSSLRDARNGQLRL